MKYIYLSHFINNSTPQYGGENAIAITQRTAISGGASSNSLHINMPNHVGTHIDFPRHFNLDGKTINDYEAGFWVFNNPYVLNYPAKAEEIICLENDLEKIPKSTDILLIITGFQKFREEKKYWNNNPGLSPDLAIKLRGRCQNLKAVGFDFISLSSYQNRMLGREAHKKFLVEHDILIIEDMDLLGITNDISQLIALPVMIDQADGGPITIIGKIE